MKPLILIGGGGHCRSVIDVIESTDNYKIIGILDTFKNVGRRVLDYKIIGTDNEIGHFIDEDYYFLNTLGQIGLPDLRRRINERILQKGGKFATIISDNAIIGKNVQIGEGTVVMHNAVVNVNSQIGNHCIINSNALVEHDCILGDYIHIAPAAVLNGGCIVKYNCFVGSGTTIIQGVSIVENSVIGAGAFVLRSLAESGTYFGNPLIKKGKNE